MWINSWLETVVNHIKEHVKSKKTRCQSFSSCCWFDHMTGNGTKGRFQITSWCYTVSLLFLASMQTLSWIQKLKYSICSFLCSADDTFYCFCCCLGSSYKWNTVSTVSTAIVHISSVHRASCISTVSSYFVPVVSFAISVASVSCSLLHVCQQRWPPCFCLWSSFYIKGIIVRIKQRAE